jgi:predicted RNase H-like HicB family nuclease
MTAGSAVPNNGDIKPFISTPGWILSNGMKQFTAIVHRGESAEGGFWATCLEVPGANGQGETKEECLGNLKEAIQLLLDTEREEVFRLDPQAETTELVLAAA